MIEDISLRRYLGLDKGYDPNQLRDERERWTASGSSSSKTRKRHIIRKSTKHRGSSPVHPDRLRNALAQTMNKTHQFGKRYTRYVIDYKVRFVYNYYNDFDVLWWDYIK